MKKTGVLASFCFLFLPMIGFSQNGPITSNLHKVLLVSGWESSDHDPATANLRTYYQNLATANGIIVDVAVQTTAPFTAANLAQYDVLVMFNLYNIGQHLDTASENRIQKWYEGNKGFACFHQCVKYAPWPWYGTIMGVDYNTYAAVNRTGPVYADAEGLGTINDAAKYTAGQSFSWSDEWYTYVANPRGKAGIKMVWTTRDADFPSSGGTFNSTMGNDHPLAWTHDVDGGRFFLNGMFHNSVATTVTGAVKGFIDDQFMGALKYLAGYTGCKDSNYVEYNRKATHQGANACLTLKSTGIQFAENPPGGIKIENLKVSISKPGKHSLEVFNTHGKKIASYSGSGPRIYAFPEIREPGVYYLKVMTSDMRTPLSRKFFLL